ncbi:MAG: replication-associated recombination protein A [Sumerlaeia bacterium]
MGGSRPLADRMRPRRFDDFLGQEKLVGEGAPLRRLIDRDRIPSMMLWGPPGSGKTTLAQLIAQHTQADFLILSAVSAGVKDIRRVVDNAKVNRQYARKTVLFLDEIHRFSRTQQDALLPHVESGLLTLIGATTENPSFSVVAPLLSRSRVFVLSSLDEENLTRLLERALGELNATAGAEGHAPVEAAPDALKAIVGMSDGDARRALGLLELAVDLARTREGGETGAGGASALTVEMVKGVSQRHLIYDRQGEEHFNVISALHKTIRSSDPHGAAYYAMRMMAGGEDPRYLLRRLVRAAAEDIGLADPGALTHAVACQQAYEKIGSPEGDIFVTQLAIYLACAPKSNAVYAAHKKARALIEETGTLPVPLEIRNAPTGLMKDLGYGAGYSYDHDAEGAFVPKQGLPDALAGTRIYEPKNRGMESRISERLAAWDSARDELLKDKGEGGETESSPG